MTTCHPIEKWLALRNITVAHFARSVGTGGTYLHAVIRGFDRPSAAMAQQIAAAADLTPAEAFILAEDGRPALLRKSNDNK